MSDELLTVANLDAHYGDFRALYGVDMNIGKGEVVAVIGANGAGKSTLLRSISGLMQNAKEQVTFKNSDISGLRADEIAHLGLALVPEGRQLFPSLSVEENLVIGGRLKRPGPWNLDTVFALFPVLAERRNFPSTALSGGQQQMVAIGRALMANPELIMFDEISLGLAPIVIGEIYKALPDVVGEGVSAIIVEQDISKALSISSRVYCLQEGRVALEGHSDAITREEISQAYFGV